VDRKKPRPLKSAVGFENYITINRIMTFTSKWEDDWKICDEDYLLSQKLLPIFESYLVSLKDKGASKTTFNRHKAACQALGGYIIDDVFNYKRNFFLEIESGKQILPQ
jgi:hypothetical protein